MVIQLCLSLLAKTVDAAAADVDARPMPVLMLMLLLVLVVMMMVLMMVLMMVWLMMMLILHYCVWYNIIVDSRIVVETFIRCRQIRKYSMLTRPPIRFFFLCRYQYFCLWVHTYIFLSKDVCISQREHTIRHFHSFPPVAHTAGTNN